MEFRVNNSNINKTYSYNNKTTKNESTSFQKQLNILNKIQSSNLNSNSKINSVINKSSTIINLVPKEENLTDDEQTLIQDKKIYDRLNLKAEGINWGSEEWAQWKKDGQNPYLIFPPLNAPWQVRKAWSEFKESIPPNDTSARNALDTTEMMLDLGMRNPKIIGMTNRQLCTSIPQINLNTIYDYFNALNTQINVKYEIFDITKDSKYVQAANLLKNLEEKLKTECYK